MKSIAAMTLAVSTMAYTSENAQKEFEFMKYVAKYGKDFKTVEEYALRFARWLETDIFIEMINHPDSGETHTAAHNKFSTFLEHEYEAMLKLWTEPQVELLEGEEEVNDLIPFKYSPERLGTTPATLDWRDSGCVTPVKNQGSCGSCWTFATTETVESAYCLNTTDKVLYTLSEQQLVDCCTIYNGCNGGNYPGAWEYVGINGQTTESQYPYVSGTNGGNETTCSYTTSMGRVRVDNVNGSYSTSIGNYLIRNYGTPEEIMAGVAVRPAAIAVNASGFRFQTYSSGVLTNCTNTSLNHAITMDGYDSTASVPYYQVRNSWGADWGLGGYILIGMTEGNAKGNCGVQQDVDYPNTASAM